MTWSLLALTMTWTAHWSRGGEPHASAPDALSKALLDAQAAGPSLQVDVDESRLLTMGSRDRTAGAGSAGMSLQDAAARVRQTGVPQLEARAARDASRAGVKVRTPWPLYCKNDVLASKQMAAVGSIQHGSSSLASPANPYMYACESMWT